MGKMQTQLPTTENLSFEQVWAILQETARRQEEIALSQKETDRVVKEIGKRP